MSHTPDHSLQRVAPDTLRIERLLDAPAETVWRWLVDPDKRALWFAGGTSAEHEGKLDLVFDHDRLSADPVPYPPEYAKHKGAVSHERVVRAEPPRLLSYTWDEGKEGLVTFELFPEGQKTRLVLTHTGITGPAPFAGFGGGWISHLAVLQRRLAGGVVRDFWALHAESRAAVQAQLQDG